MSDNNIVTDLDLTKPFFLVQVERAQGSDKFFWSPNMFIDDEAPSGYEIQENTYITRIEVSNNFDPPVNQCILTFNRVAGTPLDIIPGDKLEVFLGYYKRDALTEPEYAKVFTGFVSEIDRQLTVCSVMALSKMHILLSVRKHVVFNKDTADNIINKLVEDVEGIEVNEVSASEIQKSKYIFSQARSLYEIIKDLCIQSKFDLYTDVNDKLVAKLWEPEKSSPGDHGLEKIYPDTKDASNTKQYIHNFYFGLNILGMDISYVKSDVGSVEVVSFSSYGEDNENQYSIERTSFVKELEISADEYQPMNKKIIQLPYTPAESAEKIQDNLLFYYNPKLKGSIKVIGSPHVRLNDGLRVAGKFFGKPPFTGVTSSGSEWDARESEDTESSDEGKGKTFQIVGVNHIFSFKQGFISEFGIVEREPPEGSTGDEVEEATGTEGAEGEPAEEQQEDYGQSVVAPEYPEVADKEANALMEAQQEFVQQMEGLMNNATEVKTERSEVAKEYTDLHPQQEGGLMDALDDFHTSMGDLKSKTKGLSEAKKDPDDWYKKTEKEKPKAWKDEE